MPKHCQLLPDREGKRPHAYGLDRFLDQAGNNNLPTALYLQQRRLVSICRISVKRLQPIPGSAPDPGH